MWWESPSEPLALVPPSSLYFVTSLKESPYALTVSSGPIDGAGCEVCYGGAWFVQLLYWVLKRPKDQKTLKMLLLDG